MKNFDEILLQEYDYDNPFLVEDIVALFPDVTRAAIYQNIDRSIERGFLERYKRGVYYIPTEGILGKTLPSAEAVVKRQFIADGENVIGYYSGLTLQNKTGVSPQVPATLEITTNKASKRVREIEPFGGWKKIIVRKPRTEVNSENVEALMLLDLLTNVSPTTLDQYELGNLKKLASKVGRQKAARYARFYPGKTAKRLLESEDYGVFT